MTSGPITSWQIDGETVETVADFFFAFQNHCRWWLQHEIKRCLLLGRKVMTNLDSILKSRDITLPTKVHLVSSVTQSCLTPCDPMNYSMPSLPVHHQLPEFTQTHVHRVRDAFQPSHPLSSSSPPAPNPSQHQSLFQWVNSSQEVAKVLDFQL